MSAEYDLAALRAFLEEFEPYLKSDVLFWPIRARGVEGRQLPTLTIGGMLITRHKLAARRSQLSPADLTDYSQLNQQVDAALSRSPVAIEKRAESEFRSRLNLWASALEECGDNPAICADNFPASVTGRTILHLLLPYIGTSPAAEQMRQRLLMLDSVLRGLFVSGDFVWEANLANGFPRETYWYLYGRPRVNRRP